MTSKNRRPVYTRRLSGTERYALAINELYRYNIVAILEGQGQITRQELQSAVDIAAAANPGARVRLKYFLGFCKWVDSGVAPVVEEVQAPDWNCFTERGADFMDGSFHALQGGPVCDLYLLPGDTTRIVMRALHAAMDARGLQQFIKDIFRILRGEPAIGSNSSLTDFDVRSKFQDKIQEQPVVMTCMPILTPSSPEHAKLHYVWRRVGLTKNIGNMLPKMAVFLARHARKTSTGEVGFTIPIDLRGLREDVVTTANMTGYLRIKVEPNDTAKTVMQQINHGIKSYVDCIIPKIIKLVPWIPLSMLIRELRMNADKLLYQKNMVLPSGGIVSMGMFKPEEYSCRQYKATSCIGIPGSVGKLNVVIMNHTDHMEVIFSTPAAYNIDGQLDQLIAEFKQTMET